MFVPLTGDKYDDGDPTAYSRRHFYTLESGRENMQARVNDRISRLIGMAVEHPQFPHYQTKADFIRDAIVHRLHDIDDLVMDREFMREYERELAGERNMLAIQELKRQEELLRAATQDAIDLLRKRIETHTALSDTEDQMFWTHLAMYRRDISTEQEAELRLLLLYFAPSPADLRNLGRHPEEHEIEAWRMRQEFWKDTDYIPTLDYEHARKLGLME